MKKILILSAILILCTASAGVGYYYGGSNLYGGYPSFNGDTPSKPFMIDEFSVRRYRDEVESYVNEAEQYIENAKNDIEEINDRIRDVAYEAENVVDEYNRWTRTGY